MLSFPKCSPSFSRFLSALFFLHQRDPPRNSSTVTSSNEPSHREFRDGKQVLLGPRIHSLDFTATSIWSHLFAGRYDTETNNSLSLTRALAAANNLIRQNNKKRQKQPCWISNKRRNPSLARVRRSTQLLALFPPEDPRSPHFQSHAHFLTTPVSPLPHSVGSSCIPRYSVDSPVCTR